MTIESFESTKHSLVFCVYYMAHRSWARKEFQTEVLRWFQNTILNLASANTVHASFHYTFFQLLYVQAIQLLDFDDVIILF